MIFFADTYALMEIIKGNKNYAKFLDHELTTTLLHLYELFYNLIKNYPEEKAKIYFYQFFEIATSVEENDIFMAAKWKLAHTKQNISYADALGYAMAKRRGIKFLTGDKEFKNIENVEFEK